MTSEKKKRGETEDPQDQLNAVIREIYDQLHSRAEQYMRNERSGHTLQATALINEAYIRLAARGEVSWEGRSHILRTAARAMRNALVDYARTRNAKKRWGKLAVVPLDEVKDEKTADWQVGLIEFSQALDQLAELEPRQAEVIELRYFAGLNVPETAKQMKVSERTVKSDTRFALTWLKARIGDH